MPGIRLTEAAAPERPELDGPLDGVGGLIAPTGGTRACSAGGGAVGHPLSPGGVFEMGEKFPAVCGVPALCCCPCSSPADADACVKPSG